MKLGAQLFSIRTHLQSAEDIRMILAMYESNGGRVAIPNGKELL